MMMKADPGSMTMSPVAESVIVTLVSLALPRALRWARMPAPFLPTNASWLNWIECEFTALRYFALSGTDHRSHAEQNAAIASYVRWRNARTRPKRHFAINSPIRESDYMINVA